MTAAPPVATATLTGNPRRGTLRLPPPRPTYEVEARRTETGAELTLRAGDRVTRITLTLLEAGLDLPTLQPVEAIYHTIAVVDFYRWQFQAGPDFRELRVYDQPQPFRGKYACVDERGRVVE